MTRDQISTMMEGVRADAGPDTAGPATGGGSDVAASAGASATTGAAPTTSSLEIDDGATAVMPDVADGVAVRYVDVASPWLRDAGGDSRGEMLRPTIVARVSMRYDETKADLVHDDDSDLCCAEQ